MHSPQRTSPFALDRSQPLHPTSSTERCACPTPARAPFDPTLRSSGWNGRALARASGLPVIASGGISQLDDVRGLMQHATAGICGAITGRAIYEGTLDLAAAQRMVDAFLGGD